jgi:hypothetical protein
MDTITIPKAEYKKLQQQAKAYQKLTGQLFKSIIRDPIQDVIQDFRKTDLYTDEFLKDLEGGLRKSSYAKTKAWK